jgi:hypothetical protein
MKKHDLDVDMEIFGYDTNNIRLIYTSLNEDLETLAGEGY